MKIYLDNCCFNRPFDDQSKLKIHLETEAKLYLQQQIVKGKIKLILSYILDYENLANPYEEKRLAIEDFKKYTSENVTESQSLINTAEAIVVKYRVKPKDALHIACALEAKANILVTMDSDLIKRAATCLCIMNPIQFVINL
ncbi:MAG: PIN domain-containing protein [Candidatus Margulisiibacteriota bacterium]